MKKIVITLMLVMIVQVVVGAQTNLTVSINHPVYKLIESAEVKGLATKLSQVKPYTRRQIIEILAQIEAKSYMLTEHEKKIFDYYRREFNNSFIEDASVAESFMKGSASFSGLKSTATMGISFDSHTQLSAENGKDYYTRNPLKFYALGDIYNNMFSFRADVQFSFDRLSKDPWIHPGLWQDAGMGFHQTFNNNDAGDGQSGGVTVGYEIRPELVGSFWDHRILARFGVVEGRNVGHGNSGIAIGRYATPYQAIELNARFLPFFNFYTMTGSLGRELTDAKNGELTSNIIGPEYLAQNSKFVSYHLGEFFISDFFYFNMWESIIWGKRFEIGYLNPLTVYMLQQNLLGDLDNMALGFTGATIAPKYFKFWAETYIDEVDITAIKLNHPRAQFANQLGLKFNIPKLPFTTITAQYTKIEPYVYTHYPQGYNFNGLNDRGDKFYTDTGFTNEGKSIAHYLKPNSDEFLIKLESMPLPGLTAYIGWQLIRHGSNPKTRVYLTQDGRIAKYDPANPPKNPTDTGYDPNSEDNFFDYDGKGIFNPDKYVFWGWDPTKINGEIDAPLRYLYADQSSLKKNFLNDGVYDWTNVVSMGLSYDFRSLRFGELKSKHIPIIISFDYQLGYTFFDMNGIKIDNVTTAAPEGVNNYQPYFKNVFTLKFTIYPNY